MVSAFGGACRTGQQLTQGYTDTALKPALSYLPAFREIYPQPAKVRGDMHP